MMRIFKVLLVIGALGLQSACDDRAPEKAQGPVKQIVTSNTAKAKILPIDTYDRAQFCYVVLSVMTGRIDLRLEMLARGMSLRLRCGDQR